MNPHISAITLGVRDADRAKRFYGDGLGWPILHAQGPWTSFSVNGGSCTLGLLPWEMLADDAGAPADGSGFRGFTMSYLVRDEGRVGEVLAEAERAGAQITKPAEQAPWGGASGYFTDPDGYLWKVASGAGDQPFAE
jgi:catechol 2,3-dioxygenase-like lactoylglutathione lyase family enzyme